MEQFFAGLGLVLQGTTFLYLMGGVLLGLWFGAIPGLGGVTAMILVLPFTFGMEPAAAFALLLGALAVSTTSDTISSVMLGIPGTIASQATVIDGHQMAKQGRVLTAFGAAFTVSAIGGVIGGLALALSLPIMTWLVLTFGAPEFFVLSLIGLVMVGGVSGNAIGKGICAGALGLLISQIGYPVASSEPRYWFNSMFLIDGLPLVPVVIGLFGIPEMMQLATSGKSLATRNFAQSEGDSLMAGVRAAFAHRWLALRCSIMGTYIGMLPGLGASVVDWLAYGHAVQSARDDRSQFGKGDVRGVIAPEAANNATLGGSLIPTLSFGIPGSGAMAIMLGAMTIHGLVPGPAMLHENLTLTFSMVWSVILANIVGAVALMLWSRQVSRAAFISGNLVVPAVFVFLVMGSFIGQPDVRTLIALLCIGFAGFALRAAGWPRPPLILGFVLGPVMENSLAITAQAYTWGEVLTRPTIIILGLLLVGVFFAAARTIAKRRNDFQIELSERSKGSLTLSLGLAIGSVALFVWAYLQATEWSFLSRVFPMAIASVGALTALCIVVADIRALNRYVPVDGSDTLRGFWHRHARELAVFAMFALAVALAPVVGLAAAMVGFTALYLLAWGRFTLLTALIYAAAVGTFLYVVYHRMLHVPFLPPFFLS
ncbi:tripartite tricarboxylate transporter permease [Pararhodobacter zhoushanensis]|uniref:Tripartite tricarboxylate transporter permease n=1 Tax=Pararhodobacter zhoushanensis TaxID=2479545 RepID=A0ABT3GZA9_9RHOB|nr:tripartite tricarboxylate transporter permease [Pararhodobacter zhoushanensis]MCW1932881.1 tripartite tricarboxylate transporter permease [Pararhodobacter zhoushanensis]